LVVQLGKNNIYIGKMDIYLTIILFILLSAITYNCDISSNNVIKFKPPSFIFSLVWPIIFVLLYLASENDPEQDNLYYFLILSFFLWPLTYGCANVKTLGVYSILISLTLVFYLENEKSNKYLSFVKTWLIFALLMNALDN